MLQRKYRFAKNRGLLPLLPQPTLKHTVPYHALLSEETHEDYRVETSRGEVRMYNSKEYLHRQFESIIPNNTSADSFYRLNAVIPQSNSSLVIFIANQTKHSPTLLLGQGDKQGVVQMAYQRILEKRQSQNSQISLWVLGIESQNSLTDQLGVEWSDFLKEGQPSGVTLNKKQRVKVARQGHKFMPQAITTFNIRGQAQLKQLLGHYKWAKEELQEQVAVQRQCCYLLGQIYCLEQIQKSSEDIKISDTFESASHQGKVLSSIMVVKLNQYARANSPTMMTLGKLLRKLSKRTLSFTDCLENKLFRLLSPHLTDENCKKVLFHQLGNYPSLKDEHFCMVPLAPDLEQELPPHLHQYFYTRHPHKFERIREIVPKPQSQTIQLRGSRLNTQPQKQPHKQSIFEVSATPKAYMLPKIGKAPSQITKGLRSIKKNHALSLPSKNKQSLSQIQQASQKPKKQGKKQELKRTQSRKNQQNFYEETKAWLGRAYGSKSLASSAKSMKKWQRAQENLVDSVQISKKSSKNQLLQKSC